MSLKALTDDEKTELKEQFCVLDKEESGFIQLNELKDALESENVKTKQMEERKNMKSNISSTNAIPHP